MTEPLPLGVHLGEPARPDLVAGPLRRHAGPGVARRPTGVNNKTRNAALMAEFKTDELAPVIERLVGADRHQGRRPAGSGHARVRDRNETVHFSGDFVQMEASASTACTTRTGRWTFRSTSGLSGRGCSSSPARSDGVHLDFLLPVSYLKGAHRPGHRRRDGRVGARHAAACWTTTTLEAVDACRAFLTLYPRRALRERTGLQDQGDAGWPARPEDVKRAIAPAPRPGRSPAGAGERTLACTWPAPTGWAWRAPRLLRLQCDRTQRRQVVKPADSRRRWPTSMWGR